MYKKFRFPSLAMILGIVVLVALKAPVGIVTPFALGLVLILNEPLSYLAASRQELWHSPVLRTLFYKKELIPSRAVVFAIFATLFQLALAAVSTVTTVDPFGRSACWWAFILINGFEVTLMVLIALSHIQLILRRTHKGTLVIWIGSLNVLAFVSTIIYHLPSLFIAACALMVGLSISSYSMIVRPHIEKPRVPAIDDFYLLVFAWLALIAIAITFGNPTQSDGTIYVVAVCVAIVEGLGAFLFAALGLITLLEMSGQEKKGTV